MNTARFVVEATKAFPKDGIMIRDGGATVIFQWTYSQAKPHDVIWNQNYGHIGTGLPYAIGASLAEGGQASGHAADLRLRRSCSTSASSRSPRARTCRWSASSASTSSGASKSASTSAPSGSRRRNRRALVQERPLRQDRRGLRLPRRVSSRRKTRSGRRSSGPTRAAGLP